MSAICGMIGRFAQQDGADRELAAMLDALAVRAPDGASTWRDPDAAALLGFRWLRARPDEKDPGVVLSADGAAAMVCDGHVFNDDDQSAGTLLDRFRQKGPAGWHDLDAQFGLAIWDRRRKRLTLARDAL